MDRAPIERMLFVDLENVQKIDLAAVPLDTRVMIFYGLAQKKMPEALVVLAQPFGSRLTWIRISGQGSNALDFHIAFYLGQIVAEQPHAQCFVLSGDTGFDPLMRHLQGLGRACRRVTTLEEAFPESKREHMDHFARLLKLLKKEKSRPAKRKGLAGKLKSWFPELTEDARLALIQRLFDESALRESGQQLTYLL